MAYTIINLHEYMKIMPPRECAKSLCMFITDEIKNSNNCSDIKEDKVSIKYEVLI